MIRLSDKSLKSIRNSVKKNNSRIDLVIEKHKEEIAKCWSDYSKNELPNSPLKLMVYCDIVESYIDKIISKTTDPQFIRKMDQLRPVPKELRQTKESVIRKGIFEEVRRVHTNNIYLNTPLVKNHMPRRLCMQELLHGATCLAWSESISVARCRLAKWMKSMERSLL